MFFNNNFSEIMESDLPPGYRRETNARGRVIYITPAPFTKITSRAMLLDFQERGKFKGKAAYKSNG